MTLLAAGAPTTDLNDITASRCVWCSSTEDVAEFRREPRCGRCRAAEEIVAEARAFIRFYGLRPLGESLESEDDEEREHRVAFREAFAELRRTRVDAPKARTTPPARRTAGAASATAPAKAGGKATGAVPKVASRSTRPGVTRPDASELMNRAKTLLGQLADIEERLEVAQKDTGLSGKAKVADLTAKRDSVLRMLAALEKAKRTM